MRNLAMGQRWTVILKVWGLGKGAVLPPTGKISREEDKRSKEHLPEPTTETSQRQGGDRDCLGRNVYTFHGKRKIWKQESDEKSCGRSPAREKSFCDEGFAPRVRNSAGLGERR